MEELRQTRFNETAMPSVAAPNEPHLACVLLLDTSGSMNGYPSAQEKPIESLNKAVRAFIEQTSMDELAKKRVDVAIIEFNDSARVIQEFTPLSMLEPITLTAGGRTAMGEGINLAIDKVKERNLFYNRMGTPCYQPWIFMITDGEPTDDISSARERIKMEESKSSHGKLKFWSVGVPGYNKEIVTTLAKRNIEVLDGNFKGIFDWLSESMVIISVSQVGDAPDLPQLPENARVIPSDWK